MTLRCLKGKGSKQHKDWSAWLDATSTLYERYLDEIRISPFEENEVTLASMLSGGATLAGFLSFLELGIPKICGNDVARPKSGRSDLWIRFSSKNSYSFEIKRAKFMANNKNLEKRLSAAISNMGEVPDDEHDGCAAILAAFDRDNSRRAVFEGFVANDLVHLAFEFSYAGHPNAYLYFSNL